MKKIFLAATFIIASSLIGVAQNVEKALKNGKWYANMELGSKAITLTKSTQVKLEIDMEFMGDAALSYGTVAKSDFTNSEGGITKAGTYYVERGYGYKITGNTIVITFQPSSWTYNIKALPNGDLSLELITAPTKSTK